MGTATDSSNLPPISWERIGRAIDFYKAKGYQYIEVPWAVSEKTVSTTYKGDPMKIFRGNQLWGCPVGSAEQSFIEIKPLPGKYVACTPCFRNDQEDYFHFPHFMKVELFVNQEPNVETLQCVLLDATEFFVKEGLHPSILPLSDISFDLIASNIELGSYGIRDSWVYGTGLAEPRFSQILNQKLQKEAWEAQLTQISGPKYQKAEIVHLPKGWYLSYPHGQTGPFPSYTEAFNWFVKGGR